MSYEERLKRVQRERKTEDRIRAMDAHEIVDEIHRLEDQIERLEGAFHGFNGDLSKVEPGDFGQLIEALQRVEAISDRVVNEERYTAEDAINDLTAIRRAFPTLIMSRLTEGGGDG